MSELIKATVFVVGFFAWAFGVCAAGAWAAMTFGSPPHYDQLYVIVPLLICVPTLAWGGFFVGLRLFVGEWAFRR